MFEVSATFKAAAPCTGSAPSKTGPINLHSATGNKRDAAYYRGRLRAEHPAIYADLRADQFKSTRQAAIAAGLIKVATRGDALIREWKKATPLHRKQFLEWLKTEKVGFKKKVAAAIADGRGYLSVPAIEFLKAHTRASRITPGRIMLAMGFKRYDWRLASALKGERLPPGVIEPLKEWMSANGYK